MRLMKTTAALFLLLVCSTVTYSQVTTNGTGGGNWSATSTWAGGHVPTGSEVITILSTDSLIIDVPVTFTDTLKNMSANTVSAFDSSQVIFGAGGVYQHAVNGGEIPKATWNAGSTCLLTGIAGNAPSNGNQDFYNIKWNCPNQSSNLNLGWKGNTIAGNIYVDSTGLSRWQMCAPKSADGTTPDTAKVTIQGDIITSGGAFSSNGTSNSLTAVLVTQNGSINVTGGNFGISRGSGPDVIWKLGGDFRVTNATIQNSGGTTKANALIFTGNAIHTFALENVTFSGGLTVVIESGSTLQMGTSQIPSTNTGSFILRAGATMATGDPAGINVVQCTGERGGVFTGNSFDTTANYVFNGTTAQVTGTMLPTTVHNLTIDNAAGVALTQATRINGVLHLKAGEFDNTIPFTLGPNGSISLEGGSLKVTAVKQADSQLPHHFFVNQNFPNPFNPTTNIQYGVPKRAFVTVSVFNLLGQEVAMLFNGIREAGTYTVTLNAPNLSSGVYLYRVQAGSTVDTKRMVLLK